jgi:adenylosuccinate synthase
MSTKVVLGLQHGDEGKGRIVDDLVQEWATVVVRFQGGGNAGHTVYDKDNNKFVTHILPVGILSPSILNVISKGCVLDAYDFYEEVNNLNFKPTITLKVSSLCPIIEPTHKLIDKIKYQKKLGTTAKGIGPAYSDFFARDSILVRDLVTNPKQSLIKIQDKFFDFQAQRAQNGESFKDLEEDFETFNVWQSKYKEIVDMIAYYMFKEDINKESFVSMLDKEGEKILLEGAQGSGLNIYSSNYPNVTSSAPTIGSVLNSTGLSHKQINEVIGVLKSYKTKVGSGDFPSIITDGQEKTLAEIGKEFGATTGRPRQCGWLDFDELKSAISENGVDHLCIVKTDVMTHIENPRVYAAGELISIPRINKVCTSDAGFSELINLIKIYTGVKRISFTTGPKRGEVVWAN